MILVRRKFQINGYVEETRLTLRIPMRRKFTVEQFNRGQVKFERLILFAFVMIEGINSVDKTEVLLVIKYAERILVGFYTSKSVVVIIMDLFCNLKPFIDNDACNAFFTAHPQVAIGIGCREVNKVRSKAVFRGYKLPHCCFWIVSYNAGTACTRVDE